MMGEGKLVAVYPGSIPLRKNPAIFGLGIRNRLDSQKIFTIDVQIKDAAGATVTTSKFTVTYFPSVTIPANADRNLAVAIQAKTGAAAPARGAYSVFIKVTFVNATGGVEGYDIVQLASVTVG
jgi:hypothetical protein